MTIELRSHVAKTVSDAFPFRVERFPLEGPDNLKTPHYGLFRTDQAECVGRAVTNRYHPHQTSDVAVLADAAATAMELTADNIDIQTGWDAGQIVTIGPSKAARTAMFDDGGDRVWPRIVIRARYDARAFIARAGMYRDVCKNLMLVRKISNCTVSINHGTAQFDKRIEAAVERFKQLDTRFADVASHVQRMQTVDVPAIEYVGDVLQVTPQSPKSKHVAAIIHRLRRELGMSSGDPFGEIDRNDDVAVAGVTVSAWSAYNAVQGWAQHEKTRRNVARGDWTARAYRALDDPIVRRAEALLPV